MISSFLFCKPSLARTASGRTGPVRCRAGLASAIHGTGQTRPGPGTADPAHASSPMRGYPIHDLARVPHWHRGNAALVAVRLAPGGQRNHPVVEPLAALAERVLLALVRAGEEPVQRDRDVTSELAHRSS